MKNLSTAAGLLAVSSFASAQFVDRDLVIATQSSTGTTGALFTALDKASGASGFSTGATTFRFGSSLVSGGIKVGVDGVMYSAGTLASSSTSGRVAQVSQSGSTDLAVVTGGVPYSAAPRNGGGDMFVITSTNALQSGTVVFNNSSASSLANDGAQSGAPNIIASHNGLAYSTKSGNNNGSYGVFSGQTSAQVALFASKPTNGNLVDLWLSWDGLTMFTAQDGTTAVGGVNKWVRTDLASNFSLAYTLSTVTGSSARGARYLSVDETAPGAFTIYAATAETTGNRLVKIVDSGASSTGTLLYTAGATDQIRGVAIVPEPATMVVIGVGLAGIAARRRRK